MMYQDEWSQALCPASYGGIELDLLDTDDELGRSLTLHAYPHRDGGVAEDQGAEMRSTDCTVVFFPNLREDGHLDRLSAFLNLVHDGEAHTLSHPLTGSYRARPERIRVSANAAERDLVTVHVTFVEDDPEPAVFQVGGDPAEAAVEDVRVTVDELDQELAARGLSSPVGAESVAAVESWSGRDDGSLRDLKLELAHLANRIDNEADRLELATDLDRQPIMRTLRRLRQNLVNAAARARAAGPRLESYTVTADIPLLTLVQQLYGADAAEQRAERLLLLNDFGDPMCIQTGTVLTVEAR